MLGIGPIGYSESLTTERIAASPHFRSGIQNSRKSVSIRHAVPGKLTTERWDDKSDPKTTATPVYPNRPTMAVSIEQVSPLEIRETRPCSMK
jgi:hypothetical protein